MMRFFDLFKILKGSPKVDVIPQTLPTPEMRVNNLEKACTPLQAVDLDEFDKLAAGAAKDSYLLHWFCHAHYIFVLADGNNGWGIYSHDPSEADYLLVAPMSAQQALENKPRLNRIIEENKNTMVLIRQRYFKNIS